MFEAVLENDPSRIAAIEAGTPGAVALRMEARVQVAEYERRSLDAHQVRDLQPGFPQLIVQLPGPVAEGGERPFMQRRRHPGAVYLVDEIERRRVRHAAGRASRPGSRRPGDHGGFVSQSDQCAQVLDQLLTQPT